MIRGRTTITHIFGATRGATMEIILTTLKRAQALCITAIIFSTALAWGTEPVVRLAADPESPWVGQKVVLKLDVLSADGWAQLKKAGGTEIRGGYLLRFESQGTRLNEVIEGVSYSGQRYEFLFFAQRSGPLTIPEMEIDVEVKRWGADSDMENTRLTTPPLQLSVRQPPGAEQVDGLISTTGFSATQSWTPTVESLTVGDALIRKISLTAEDATGMAFRPLDPSDTEGISTYLSEPILDDSYNRGTLVGARQEKLTYVFERAGIYTLPDLSYNWWNTSSEKLETITLTGLSVEVQGGDMGQSQGLVEEKGGFSTRSLLWIIGLVAVLAAAVYRSRTTLLGLIHSWQRAFQEAEWSYFRKVKSAARQGNPELMMRAVLQWLDRLATEDQPARLDLFLNRYSDASGRGIYDEYAATPYGAVNTPLLQQLCSVLAASRSRRRKERKVRKKADSILPEVGLGGSGSHENMSER